MKTQAFLIPLLIAAFSFAATISLQAAPSLPITKGPVTPLNQTGPNMDPGSTNGQWFVDLSGIEKYRTHEFHDNTIDYGGSSTGHLAIKGVVKRILYDANSNITAFDVDATIFNDTPTAEGNEADGSNSHNESRQAGAERYIGTLFDTKLTAEFAIADLSMIPGTFTGPYHDRQPYIIAENEEQYGWYCWNEQDPPAGDLAGNYHVPTWDFGDIPINQSVTKELKFSVIMNPLDLRYGVIESSLEYGLDIFANRTISLKISTWIDEVAIDIGHDYPAAVARSSDVSVFHNIEVEPEYPHKMHWPQLPDPNGWDVRACMSPPTDPEPDGLRKVLADDFQCTSNGISTRSPSGVRGSPTCSPM